MMQKIIYKLINKIFMNEVENDLIKLIKSKEKVIFDVGCYRGNFTENILKIEKNENENYKFYLFDPNPNVKEYLKELLVNENIKYFELALDNSNTTKKFTINRYFEPSGSSLNSAHQKDHKYNFSRKLFMKIFQPFTKIEDYEQIDVQTQTLDNFCLSNDIEKIDLLKLDTDGTEYELLNGAKKMLSEGKIEIIYTEISGFKNDFDRKINEIKDFLGKYNFELKESYNIASFSLMSNLKSTDNLFVKKTNNN